MDRVTDEILPPRKRPRTGGLQGETERTGQSSQGSSFNSYGAGDQFNAPGGNQNISKGPGNQFPGATFHAPVYFGTEEPFDPLRECLRSLAFREIDSRSHDIDTAAQGTCEWLLRHQTYTSWEYCDRGLLWIKGKPGSGKSTLLRHTLNNVMKIPNIRESALILSFFFHGRGSELQKTPLGLFRSLFHQLLRQVPEALTDLVDTFQQRCESIGKPGEQWQWHPRELPRFFESSLRKVLETRTVWLFVDALDECGEENAVNLAEEFKSLLQRLPPSDLKQFRICFTCRHYPILDLDGVLEICVEKGNGKDISTFVQDKLSSFCKRTSSTIPDLITKRADGVFLWAWLMVKKVLDLEREGVGIKNIEAKIRSVPQELDALYCELIRNMGSESLKLVQWICFAMRPLSLDELRWAMLVDADCPHRSLYECQTAEDYPSDDDGMKRRVQTLSCGLAEVTLSSGDGEDDLSDVYSSSTSFGAQVVQFIHQSVKDFFVEKGLSALDGAAKPDFAVGIAHHRLSRTCLRYLAMEEIGQSARHERYSYHLKSKFPFLHYATASWVAHMRQSDARSVPQEDLLAYFTGSLNTLVEQWVRIYRILEGYSDDCPAEGTSVVHVMSRYGVAGVLWVILERADQVGIIIDGKDSKGRTPLWWAAARGHEAVVRLLLEKGAHTEAADKWGSTPLLAAAANGDEAVVRLLVDRGAHSEAADVEGQTPLLAAAANGHEAVVQLLLEKGAHTEAADKWGSTPLLAAAANGDEAVVRLLLERGARTEAADEEGRTPLSWAATFTTRMGLRFRPQAPVQANHPLQDFRMQLMRLAQQNKKRLMMARSWAAERGHEAVVRLLLEKGAHTEVADEKGRTPLSYAAANWYEAVVRLLLEKGADTKAADKAGRTPLSYAAEYGHEAVVRLLLDRGAHIEAEDKEGRTPLSYASERGHEAVVGLLLERGAHTEVADKAGRTPLSYAVANGHEAIVGLLLDRGADIEAEDEEGRTPLMLAAANGHEAVVRLLLDRGADIEAVDEEGRTPLSYAVANGHEAVVRLLLEKGADIEAEDEEGRTPLMLAAARGRHAVVRLLQVHIAQPSSTTLR